MRFLRHVPFPNSRPTFFVVALAVILAGCSGADRDLKIEISERANPWTHLNLYNSSDNFQFAIVADRTGGHRPGIFAEAVEKLNLLKPEFVMCVGDLIEGYIEDEPELDRQWQEFDSLANRLEMPFFYVPGNHDISNEVMAKKWRQRRGAGYYHFVYRNVLFLCLNTEDSGRRYMSERQIDYFRDVLTDNRHVRWILIFMHEPMWLGASYENWQQFDSLLQNKNYTVFAGHTHTYSKLIRNGTRYYILATTGGSGDGEAGKPAGVAQCQFDHIVWVTMADDGPVLANLLLEGVLDDEPCPQ